MKIKFLAKEYSVEMNSLADKTVGGLKNKIREVIPQCSAIPDDKIKLFFNKSKISAPSETALDDESVGLKDDSTVFVVVISSDIQKQATNNKTSEQTSQQRQQQNTAGFGSQSPAGFGGQAPAGFGGQAPFGMGSFGGMENMEMMEQMLNNPEMLESMMNMMVPDGNPEKKAALKSGIEMMKKNPELMKQMWGNMQNNGMNPMMGSPMMPGWYNPMMQGQMSQMGSPMMNYQMSPNYMQNMYQQQATPPNGPCSHGFYPPKYVDGKPTGQDAEEVYAEELKFMDEMGFTRKDENVKALTETRGDVSAAIDYLTRKKDI